MFNYKKRILTHLGAIAFVVASIGSGFGQWVFSTRTADPDPIEVQAIETDALVYSEKINCSFISESLIIDDTDPGSDTASLSGFSIYAGARFEHIGDTNTKSFSVKYTVECTISDNSGETDLSQYLYLSSVSEITTTKSKDEIDKVKDDTSDKSRVEGTNSDKTANSVDLSHKFTYVAGTYLYDMKVVLFPYFSYKEHVDSVEDFAILKTAVSNATFSFVITLTDVVVGD